jgi:hypothetical protein
MNTIQTKDLNNPIEISIPTQNVSQKKRPSSQVIPKMTEATIGIFLGLLTAPLFSKFAKPYFQTCTSTNLALNRMGYLPPISCYGNITLPDGQYLGNYKYDNGSMIPHGDGNFTFTNGDTYAGKYQNGKKDGVGVYTQVVDDSIYFGQFKDDKKHGIGRFFYKDNFSYHGDYEEDKRSGFGTLYMPNNEVYVGEMKNGKAHGQGQKTLSNNGRYTGSFLNGAMSGEGVYEPLEGVKCNVYMDKNTIYGFDSAICSLKKLNTMFWTIFS